MEVKMQAGLILLLLAMLLGVSCNEAPETETAQVDTSTETERMPDRTPDPMETETPDTTTPDETIVAVAQPAPDFTLPDLNGQQHSLQQLLAGGNTVVLEWFNPGCSVVHHYYQESTAMVDAYKQAQAAAGGKLVWLAVVSQDPAKSGGSVEDLTKAVTDWKIPYPVLRDESGAVGKAYQMTATPAIAVISPDGKLQYTGSLDEYAKGGGEPPVGKNFVVQAVTELAAGGPVTVTKTNAVG